jgi:hypothetical protein
MLRHIAIATNTSQRKIRLFACFCCREIWHLLTDQRSRFAVEFAERFADGRGSRAERLSALGAAKDATTASQHQGEAVYYAACAAEDLVFGDGIGLYDGSFHAKVAREHAHHDALSHPDLLREIIGNPFRSVGFDSAWRTPDVAALATGIYESRDFSPMPILADALQDAGCTSEDILNHLRDSHATHVRGCWALDLVLGKS